MKEETISHTICLTIKNFVVCHVWRPNEHDYQVSPHLDKTFTFEMDID